MNGISVITYPTSTNRFLWMNGEREPFSDPLVRDAIRYAIDIDAIIEELFAGQGVRATGCVAEGVYGYSEQPAYSYDPDKARELLAEAGYKDGFQTEMKVIPTIFPKQKEMAEVIAAYLADVGIEAKVTMQDQTLWIDDLLSLNWDMNLLGTGTITGDADFTLRRIYQTDAKRTGYYNDEVNTLLVEQQSVLDNEKRLEMLDTACSILWDDGPTVWLFQTTLLYGMNDRVKGFTPRSNEFIYYDKMYLED
jgi:peptide/nickel transport system substrate-binding protein